MRVPLTMRHRKLCWKTCYHVSQQKSSLSSFQSLCPFLHWSSFSFIYPFPCICIYLLQQGSAGFWYAKTLYSKCLFTRGKLTLAFYSNWWEVVFMIYILNQASLGMEIIKNHSSKSIIMEHKSSCCIFWPFFLSIKGKMWQYLYTF